jgi:hypothetical protein
LRTLTVEVKAGRAARRHQAVESDGPHDLVFQSVQSGCPMRDNHILTRHIKPSGRKLDLGWATWLVLRRRYATWLAREDFMGLLRNREKPASNQDSRIGFPL